MPKLGISFQIWFFPQFWGKKWRRSEHALASNTGLSLFPPGFQAHFQGGVRGSPGTGLAGKVRVEILQKETQEKGTCVFFLIQKFIVFF